MTVFSRNIVHCAGWCVIYLSEEVDIWCILSELPLYVITVSYQITDGAIFCSTICSGYHQRTNRLARQRTMNAESVCMSILFHMLLSWFKITTCEKEPNTNWRFKTNLLTPGEFIQDLSIINVKKPLCLIKIRWKCDEAIDGALIGCTRRCAATGHGGPSFWRT